LANFDGLVGGETLDAYAALFDTRTGEFFQLTDGELEGSAVEDISENGHVVVDGFEVDNELSGILFLDTDAGTREVIHTGPGIHESPRVNAHGEVALYNNHSGVWVWPQMANLPIAEEFDPLLIELGVIHPEIGMVQVYDFTDEGWVGGRIIRPGETDFEYNAFLWNFHTDEFFELTAPAFDDVYDTVTAVGPDGRGVVINQGPSGPNVAYRWDGTELEPLDPQGPFFAGDWPPVDVNASGQAVGGYSQMINDRGQIVSISLYAAIRNKAGDAWNTSTGAFQAINAITWPSADIALTEQGSTGDYYGSFPPTITANNTYFVEIFEQLGASPVRKDDWLITSTPMYWTGSELLVHPAKCV
jgi:hypothetical protein